MKSAVKLALAGVVLVSAFAASAALADNVNIDYNHRVDFSQYRTYSWGGVKAASSFYVNRIERFVDEQLQSKGWRRIPTGGQVIVFATDRVHTEQELESDYMGMGGGWRGMGGEGFSNTMTVDQRVGNLVTDLFDAQNKQLLWRGSFVMDLSDNSAKNRNNLRKNIVKMFRKFPPRMGG